MCLLRRSLITWSPEFTSGDFIFNPVTAGSGVLEIGARQHNNWRLHEPPDLLPFGQPGVSSTCLYCSLVPRHHFRLPGRYTYKDWKGKFVKVRPNEQDPSLLDGFPLYWVHKGNKDSKESFRTPRSPDNMGELDKDLCLFWKSVAAANITFPTASIISFEFLEGQLEAHIG